jgi:hypothetical protein
VNGTSTSLAVTANGNFQANQAGIYEVNMCLNTVGNTPVKFQVGTLLNDTLSPSSTVASYLYSYSPMYTQDPSTAIKMPLNITNISNVYFVECSFAGTVTGNVALNQTSTFVSIKPIGGYINTGTNPWTQQGTSVYYNGGPVGVGVVPTALTETLTVSGNTSFVGNVTRSGDFSSNTYVNAKRVPAGSLQVSSYVTGSAPLTTTTSLINNYLSNAAAVVTSAPTYNPALSFPGTASSWVQVPYQSATTSTNNSNIFVEAWVYVSSILTYPPFVASQGIGDDWSLRVNTGVSPNKLEFYVVNTLGSVISNVYTSAFATGSWVYVAGSFDATNNKLYTFTGSGTSAVVAGNGTGTAFTGTARNTAGNSLTMGGRSTEWLNGYIYDARVYKGGIVPTGTPTSYAITSATPYVFGRTQPSYVTGTPTLHMSMQTQYFPGASTSPYGPCLTLPGTVGSYYSNVNTAYDTNWKTNGFCLEAWVNYASLANSNGWSVNYSYPYSLGHLSPTGATYDWGMGPTTTGQIVMYWFDGTAYRTLISTGTITTGSWNHIMVQCNSSNVYCAINGTFQLFTSQGTWTPSGGNGTIAPSFSPSVNPIITAGVPLTIGQYGGATGPNFAIARARLVFGTSGTPSLGNVYSSGNFTANPNFAAVPAGATVAWQLESQYPLPTFPSIQDVTELPQQASSYGSLPTPVGGVTSNTLSPYTGTQLQSLRFDGTGYIDYGNAATSALTTNLWANAWTIEAWVYISSYTDSRLVLRETILGGNTDWTLGVNTSGVPYTNSNTVLLTVGSAIPLNTWTHLAATYDGSKSNIYQGTSGTSSTVASSTPLGSNMVFTPTYNFRVGGGAAAGGQINGNLADVRVSNVARYTGTTYSVPSQPFSTDANTLLLLKSLAQQPGTTLEVQGRGLNSVSLGATRTTNAYPPAPMSSYLLDTTSNSLVTYGQGKYIASASSEYAGLPAWAAFDKTFGGLWAAGNVTYTGPGGTYVGSITTVDTLGVAYAGEWIQIQTPMSIILSTYTILNYSDSAKGPSKWWILGSRDGVNWTLVDSRTSVAYSSSLLTFTPSSTQAYNFYRMVISQTTGGNLPQFSEWTLNGTEESLCITNDAKVGVGIANPQRSLEVAGDLVVGGTVSAGNPLMYRNRIINGDMRIAQRGTTSTIPGVNGTYYLIDRLAVGSNDSTAWGQQTQQTLVASDTPYQLGIRFSHRTTITNSYVLNTGRYVFQNIEGYNTADCMWGTSFGVPVTVSFWFRTNAVAGTVFVGRLNNSNYNYSYNFQYTATSTSGQWQYITFTAPPPPNGSTWVTDNSNFGIGLTLWAHQLGGAGLTSTTNAWVNGNYAGTYAAAATPWWLYTGNYIEFTGVQLEKGTVATPFEVRPYSTELILCQTWNNSSAGTGSTSLCLNTGGGNVGIGTTNPSAQFHVQTNTNSGSAINQTYFLNYAGTALTVVQDPGNTNLNNGYGGGNACLYVSKAVSTGRSVNAAGTLNASGVDYAEYMTKSGDFTIQKGDVCGVNAQGLLTNVFADSVTFVVKTTNPSIVGGDVWGTEEALGLKKPEQGEDLEQYTAKLEEARARVDRIAFAGQVPVNVLGATPGQYIVPVANEDGSISGQAVSTPTFEQYTSAVGKVIKILPDGRAQIIVKVA